MKTKSIIIALSLVTTLSPALVSADNSASGQNFLVLDNKAWPTSEKTGFFRFNGKGVSNITSGPTETVAIECNGSGFWGAEGNRAEGICIHGSGDSTFTSSYKKEMGADKGVWEIISGKGTYAGISGKGTFVPNQLAGNRAISTWKGEITLAN